MSVHNLLTHPPSLPLVAPSILSADFADLAAACRATLEAGADLLHLDVMDGHFVPNLTMGPALCRSLHQALPEAFLDVHLMVSDPAMFVEPFAEAGAGHLTFHVEAVGDPLSLIETIHEAGLSAGVAINPDTDPQLLRGCVEACDMVLVMSVHPGFSGQSFIPGALETTRTVRGWLTPRQRLEMDGGLDPRTAPACREAGCDVLAAASAIFRSDDQSAAVEALRGSATVVGR